MTTQVKVQTNPKGTLVKKPSYLLELEAKWKRWTGIDDKEAFEALKDLSGDLWGELRKLEAQLCKEIENRELPEDFKEFTKAKIRDTWRDIIGHQKIGLDKLCIVVRRYLDEDVKEDK
jgi:hypothetical protein